MIFAGVEAGWYEFLIERTGDGGGLAMLARAKKLQAQGWDVTMLGADDGSGFVLLALLYAEDPSPPKEGAEE